jgi:DNA (cytosine-5)-methyltransferase 1
MSKPRLLDLFCGAGGAAMGYARAGFEVVGVDINPQPHYPFEFHQGDALQYLAAEHDWCSFDAIHASPPCQDHMITPHPLKGTGWLLDATRQNLLAIGRPWVIENVGHGIRRDYVICGCQVGVDVRRVRFFETSWHGHAMMPGHNHTGPVLSVVGSGTPSWVVAKWNELYGRNPSIEDYRRAMGIDWMNRKELSQAIPPAYTEFIGQQLLQHLPGAPVEGEE